MKNFYSTVNETSNSNRMTLPKGMTKDALLITYYKMNSKGSKQLYGTEKAVTVAVSSQTSPQVVSINGLDSGSKYGVRCTLRVCTYNESR